MVSGFQKALPFILAYEGGKVDDPQDPGGRTNQGITQKVYDAYRRRNGLKPRDVYAMANTERDAIYKTQYWDAVHGDDLPEGVGLVVFDGAVNSGPTRSAEWLQKALGVDVDGHIGMMTLNAANEFADHDLLISKIIERRESFLKSLKTFKRFGNGWLNRTASVEKTGQAWASGSVGPPIAPLAGSGQKAMIEDMVKPPASVGGDIATGVGVGSGGVSVAVSQLQEQLTPFSMAGGWITKLVIALAIISAVLTVGGLAWRAYAMWKRRKIEDASGTTKRMVTDV